MANQTIELEPGESEVVSFKTTPSEARTFLVSVDGLAGSFIAIKKITTVTVSLKNAPGGANGWVFTVRSHDEANSIGCAYHTIDEPITQEAPESWFPLYFSIAFFSAPFTAPILYITNVPSLYWASGYDASLPPITDYGNYYFNVATRKFEPM